MAHKRLWALSHKGLNLGPPNLLTLCLLEEKLKELLFQAQPPHTCLATWELGLRRQLAVCPHALQAEKCHTPAPCRPGRVVPTRVGPSVKALRAALPVLTVVSI